MPSNPERAARGGDVEGETPIDVTHGEAIKVSKASYDPGYDVLDNTLAAADISRADLVTGFCSYGKSVGEA